MAENALKKLDGLVFTLKIDHLEIVFSDGKTTTLSRKSFYLKNLTKIASSSFCNTLLGGLFCVKLRHWQQIQGNLINMK